MNGGGPIKRGGASEWMARRYLIRGRVQGVWYRASTREEASRLGVSGWVRNLPGGEVEAVACGRREELDALEQWLWRGPRGAKVTAVEVGNVDYAGGEGFEVVQ